MVLARSDRRRAGASVAARSKKIARIQQILHAEPLSGGRADVITFPVIIAGRVHFVAIMLIGCATWFRLPLVALGIRLVLGIGWAANGGWGIDAGDTTLKIDPKTLDGYVAMLHQAKLVWVRVRAPNDAAARLHDEGFRVDSFLSLGTLPIEQRGDVLPEDLSLVFAAAWRMQKRCGRYIEAWEMVGEPDLGFCRDLPERVVAFQKAVYLGICAGVAPGKPRPIILMGALGLPPGRWLERAEANGLLDYTDAYNVHYYGFEQDLTAVIGAHERHAAGRSQPRSQTAGPALPIWITECGVSVATLGDFMNPERRALQAQFTLRTSEQAAAAPSVSVFMPFVLAGNDDPHALTLGPDRPLPAWVAYANQTQTRPFPNRAEARKAAHVDPVVVQWMPDLDTAIPHKVSGTYRFWQHDPIRGMVRIYNFAATPARGTLRLGRMPDVVVNLDGKPWSEGAGNDLGELIVPAMGRMDLAVTMTPTTPGYFLDHCDVHFVHGEGRESNTSFGIESALELDDFTETPLPLSLTRGLDVVHPELDGANVTSRTGPWVGINGLDVEGDSKTLNLRQREHRTDPLFPACALASVAGLPSRGFIRVRSERPADPSVSLRLDLIDRLGQRFAIWENGGASYFGPANEVWLNLEDFSLFAWGRCTDRPEMRAAEIDQIRVRSYQTSSESWRTIRLSLLVPKVGAAVVPRK